MAVFFQAGGSAPRPSPHRDSAPGRSSYVLILGKSVARISRLDTGSACPGQVGLAAQSGWSGRVDLLDEATLGDAALWANFGFSAGGEGRSAQTSLRSALAVRLRALPLRLAKQGTARTFGKVGTVDKAIAAPPALSGAMPVQAAGECRSSGIGRPHRSPTERRVAHGLLHRTSHLLALPRRRHRPQTVRPRASRPVGEPGHWEATDRKQGRRCGWLDR